MKTSAVEAEKKFTTYIIGLIMFHIVNDTVKLSIYIFLQVAFIDNFRSIDRMHDYMMVCSLVI